MDLKLTHEKWTGCHTVYRMAQNSEKYINVSFTVKYTSETQLCEIA